MEILETPVPGLVLIKPVIYTDQRGYFFESYNKLQMKDTRLSAEFFQDNESMSVYGVIRGLHYQLAPYAQVKLVRVVKGAVFDVAVDLRKGSPTFGKWYGAELSGENKMQMLIPGGFAHGFSVLSETVIFVYKCDQPYNREMERCIHYNDPVLQIDWKIPENERCISVKDQNAPLLKNAEMNFIF
jgi:dTDP-4-dehydrorhamnose 3,5-epimerase